MSIDFIIASVSMPKRLFYKRVFIGFGKKLFVSMLIDGYLVVIYRKLIWNTIMNISNPMATRMTHAASIFEPVKYNLFDLTMKFGMIVKPLYEKLIQNILKG